MRKRFVLLLLLLVSAVSVTAQDDIDEIARYSVGEGGEISLITGEADELHEDLWILMIVLLPTEYVEQYIVEYVVFDSEDTLAYVTEFEEDQWEFAISINDDPERALTVIHEFGHIVALNNTQYDTYPSLLDPTLSDEEFEEGLEDDIEDCLTIPFEDGCPIAGSYLALFTQEFWDEDDVALIVNMELDDSATYFFDVYPDAFVTEYAATNPIEDFAESFSYFIGLDDEDLPFEDSDWLMDAKILWFEQFPELVDMRESIRGNAEANDITFVFGENSYYFE